MVIETLLHPRSAPLKTLSLERISISPKDSSPHEIILANNQELLFYPLIGQANIRIDKEYELTLGGRSSVRDPAGGAIRVAPGLWDIDITVANNEPVDFLLVRRVEMEQRPTKLTLTYHQANGWSRRQVGEGTHQRTVSDLAQPRGYHIAAGETLNVPGGWSSWPAHATGEDQARFLKGEATWEEIFFCITPGHGIMMIDGYYNNETGPRHRKETRRVANGEALVTPLGSHPIVASPGAWLWYAWFYTGTALQKTYNAKATDLGTYIK